MERVTSLSDTETPIPRHRRIELLYGQYRIPDDFAQLEVIECANTYSSPVYFAPTA
jgi:hypothetical protein